MRSKISTRLGRVIAARHNLFVWLAIAICFCLGSSYPHHSGVKAKATSRTSNDQDSFTSDDVDQWVEFFCVDCHQGTKPEGDLSLEAFSFDDMGQDLKLAEKIVKRLRTRQMPPPEANRPDEQEYRSALEMLEQEIARQVSENELWTSAPALRRLTRTEYQNAVRDLLHVEIDASSLLPADSVSHGFDNITVSDLSPTSMERYLAAAESISQKAVGASPLALDGTTIRVPPDRTQEERLEGLPFGTRGGVRVAYHFARGGEYEIRVRLMRDRNEEVEGLYENQTLLMLLDEELLGEWKLTRPKTAHDHAIADAHLVQRFSVPAGKHQLGVTFQERSNELLETRRQPYDAQFNMHRHPRQNPAVYEVSIVGPYEDLGVAATESRRSIFGDWAAAAQTSEPLDEEAEALISSLATRAYRKPVTDRELKSLLRFYHEGKSEAGFELGMQRVVAAILVNPRFLFRIEAEKTPVVDNQTSIRIDDFELATRLSFFLWSSIPDQELLDLASRDELHLPENLSHQVERMLNDSRSESLATNFASQWLYLRNLDSIRPNLRLFPDFDDNLRQSMRRETELFFDWVVRSDRSVLELIDSDHTFLNERLAKHYRIPHVLGSHFRDVALENEQHRGGLLRQASILTVTSYATRTSPVIRGDWVLENMIGTPPPPPPSDVPSLDAQHAVTGLTILERLEHHRADPACATCHRLMDPVGFSLESFDAVGRWRELDNEQPVYTVGGLPDGSNFTGVEGLESALLERPEQFVETLTEKLMTFALGRGMEPTDGPFIRQVVEEAKNEDYRFSAIVQAIVETDVFQKRISNP